MISPSAVVAGTQGRSGRSGAMSIAEVAQPASRADRIAGTVSTLFPLGRGMTCARVAAGYFSAR